MRSFIISLVAILIVVVGAIILINSRESIIPPIELPEVTGTPIPTLEVTESPLFSPVVSASPSQSVSVLPTVKPSGSVTPKPSLAALSDIIVTKTDVGFLPSTVRIKVGGKVTWKNQSTAPMWPASGNHPSHNVYPVSGGNCGGSSFDACEDIAPDQSWSFVFTALGSWGYHDHLNPAQKGTVIVE